jgi:pSer/pThr/pTyr-binding forkhead associated (FHA) protein
MDMIECPNCKSQVPAEATFCDHCGVALADVLRSDPPSSLRLIIRSHDGVVVSLPADRSEYLIGRKDPAIGSFPDVDLVPFGGEEGGVSRRHARITQTNGQFFVEDLNSVNYTFVNRQKIEPGTLQLIRDGDEIRLGRVIFVFKID